MEQGPHVTGIDDVYADVQTIIALLERRDETTWSRRIAHTLTGTTSEEILPLLRHELCGLRRAPVARALGLVAQLDALVAVLNEALAPYGYRPQRCGDVAPSSALPAVAGDNRADAQVHQGVARTVTEVAAGRAGTPSAGARR
jgi:hypothetical protein